MKFVFYFFLLLLFILLLRLFFYYGHVDTYSDGDHVELEHVFLKEPQVKNYYQRFSVSDIFVYTDLFPRYSYGERVIVSGEIEEVEFVNDGGVPVELLVLRNPEIEHVEQNNLLFSLSSVFREQVRRTFVSHLGRDESGLLLGVVFGIREGLSDELYEVFRTTGVLHVIAASGSNVALVGGFLLVVGRKIFRRELALVFVIFGIFFYSLLSGLDASILRASIMGGFAYGALILGRQYHAYIGLFLASYVMILFSPQTLGDVGFWLSVSSTFGILSFKPILDALWGRWSDGLFLQDISTTVSATLGNLPVLLYFFSSYSLIAIPVNVFVLWTVPLLMILGGAASLLSFFSEIFAIPFLYLSIPLLSFFLWITQLFPQGNELKISFFSLYFVLGYYCLYFAVIIWLKKRKVVEFESS